MAGNTIDGEGWTIILDSGSSVTGQASNSFDLTSDAAGILTFDDGGSVDLAGIDRVTF